MVELASPSQELCKGNENQFIFSNAQMNDTLD